MLKKLNTLLRLLVVGLLIYPFPIPSAMAVEVTETETFDGEGGTQVTDLGVPSGTTAIDSDNVAIRNDQNCCGVSGQYFFSLLDNQTQQNANTTGFTFTLPTDHDITEVGFRMAGVNSNYTIQYNYSDASSEQVSKNGQSGASYEDITKAVTNKFITSFTVTVSDWSGIDTIYWKYDDGLTSGIGPPTNLATTQNLHSGAVGVTWTAPTGYTNTPERYAVAFSDDNFETTNFAVATTTNSGDTAYTFSKQYLLSTFTDLEVGDTLYFKVRSDDDTNSLYSSWTDVISYTIPDVASGVSTLTANQDNHYTGITFYWTQPNTGWATQTSYKLAYKDSDDTEFTYVTGISADATNYTWTEVLEDTYEFYIYACTQNDGWCHGPQNGPITVEIAATTPTTTTTTTTIVYTLGPPMNPVVTQEYNVGVNVDWDEPNTGNATATSYELYYRTSAEDEIKIENITETEYTIPYANIPNGTYEFSIRAIDSVNSVNSGYSTEPTLTVFNQKAQDDADAAAEEERKRKEREEAERRERERQAELQRQRDKNLSETGYSETDQERSDREYREEQERLAELQRQRDKNASETGYSETDQERADREQREYEEEQARLQAEREKNYAETGYMELDSEREARELAEEKARIEEEIKNSVVIPIETETDEDGNVVEVELTEEEQEELEELVDAIIDIKNTVDFEEFEVEEEVFEVEFDDIVVIVIPDPVEETIEEDEVLQEEFEFPEVVELTEEETEELSEKEIKEIKEERKEVVEAYVEELEEEIIEEVLPETVTVEEFKEIKDKDVEELTEEEVAIVVEVATEVIEEVVDTEELTEVIEAEDIVILEEEELEDLSEEELEAYEEELEEVIEEFVEELETEELVVVVEQIAEVGVENLAVADEQTVKVVQAVVAEVVDTETVAELSEEEVEAVAEVLGFEEEEDVEIIAEIAAKDETVAEAVSEYVERAVDNAEVENYTLADVVTEVQVEVFLDDPVGAIIDIDLENITISSIGSDMTSDQKEKAQEVVVPVIIASQIIANAGALIRRPF